LGHAVPVVHVPEPRVPIPAFCILLRVIQQMPSNGNVTQTANANIRNWKDLTKLSRLTEKRLNTTVTARKNCFSPSLLGGHDECDNEAV